MRQRRLGGSGLRVSRIGLGTMSWGEASYAVEAACPLVASVEARGTLVDTAGVYCDGGSERILGSLLGDGVARDDIVTATNAAATRNDGPLGSGASRGALLIALEG